MGKEGSWYALTTKEKFKEKNSEKAQTLNI
jgi:hypothetical protein